MIWLCLIVAYFVGVVLVTWWAKTVQLPFVSYCPYEDWLDSIAVGLVWPLYAAYFLLVAICLAIRCVFGVDPDE
jgi:hypothetical protein